MEIIASERGVLIVQDGFFYRKNRNWHGKVRYLICANQACQVRARLEGNKVLVSGRHNHLPDESHRDILNFKAALKEAALNNPNKKPKQIYQDVCKRFPNVIPKYKASLTLIHRYLRNPPKNPEPGEDEDKAKEDVEPEVKSDVASQLDFNTMSSAMAKTRKSANSMEVETLEVAGPSNIESQPCSSTSKIQFMPSELTSLQDIDFGTLEESGLGSFTPKVSEKAVTKRQGPVNEKKEVARETKAQASVTSSGEELQEETMKEEEAQVSASASKEKTQKETGAQVSSTASKNGTQEDTPKEAEVQVIATASKDEIEKETEAQASATASKDVTQRETVKETEPQVIATTSKDETQKETVKETEGQVSATALRDKTQKKIEKKTGAQTSSTASSNESQKIPWVGPIGSKYVTMIDSVDKNQPVNKSIPQKQSMSTQSKPRAGYQPLVSKLFVDPIEPEPMDTGSFVRIPVTKNTKALEKAPGKVSDNRMRASDVSNYMLGKAIDRLESVSNKLIAASLSDKYDQFGKYICSLMRGLPTRKVNNLKKKLISQVLEALYEEDKDPSKSVKSVATQVTLDKPLPSAFKSYPKEQEQLKSKVSKEATSSPKFNPVSFPNTSEMLPTNNPVLVPNNKPPSLPNNMPITSTNNTVSLLKQKPVVLSKNNAVSLPKSNPVSLHKNMPVKLPTNNPASLPINIATSLTNNPASIPINKHTSLTNIPKSLANNMPIKLPDNFSIVGGNMPIFMPGTSSATFQLLPVIPVVTSPRASVATAITTPSTVNPVASVQPLTACEDVTTVGQSADGTLLAVTIQKPQMTEKVVRTNESLMDSQRGQKRQKTTSAYFIKKCKCTSPQLVTQTGADCSNTGSPTTILSDNRSQLETVSRLETVSLSNSISQLQERIVVRREIEPTKSHSSTQTAEHLQSEENRKDCGGGNTQTVCQPVKREDPVEQELEMDIEEGNELLEMKEEHEYFEVLCAEESSMTDFCIKEEAPDLEESPPQPVSPSASFECPLCNKRCSFRQQLINHLADQHTGSIHADRGASEDDPLAT